MTTTVRIAAKTAADLYVFSVAVGVTAQFGASNLKGNEVIRLEKKQSGAVYEALTFTDASGKVSNSYLSANSNTISITGPIDARFNKPITALAVEVVQYS